jgi:hypothetical protein
MTDTSSHLPVCIYCGTPRPADETMCPSCGKPWIDGKIPEASTTEPDDVKGAVAVGTAAAAARSQPPNTEKAPPPVPPPSIDDTGEFGFDDWTLPPEKPRSIARWLIPIVLAIAVIVVWGFVFLDRTGTPGTTVASATAITNPQTSTTQLTSTTVPRTTTTSQTTTQIPFPPPASWSPVGDPIASDDLTLRAAAIGPLDIGEPIEDVAGRLTASLGEAEAAGVDGVCPPEESYWLQWGDLLAIFDSSEPDGTFVSYRYEDIGSDTHLGLTTLSGLELGDTVADLQQIYGQFTITFEVIDGHDYFRLVDGGELLLWGPVTGTDSDDLVEGIYSPTPCPEDAQ